MPPQPQSSPPTTEKTTEKPAEAEFLFVENTSRQLHGIPKALSKAEQRSAGALIQPISINLTPGLNKVSTEAWEEAKKQKMVELHIKEGTFREYGGVKNFSDTNPEQARNLISLCLDVKLLEEWRRLDNRGLITKAIDVRLAALRVQEPGTVKPDEVKGLK